MNSQNFYYILPELLIEISLEHNHEALLIVKKYCDECDWIKTDLSEGGTLTLKTDEVATAIYCGLDPIVLVTSVGLATVGTCWWATSLFTDCFERTNQAWEAWRKRRNAKPKHKPKPKPKYVTGKLF